MTNVLAPNQADPWITVEKVGKAAVFGAVVITTVTLIGSGIILASPALPPILGILITIVPPFTFMAPDFFSVSFVALPVLIATSVYSAAFMIPFGIVVGSLMGTAALLYGVGVLMKKIGENKTA